jgi:hypothetical protein
MRRTTTHYLLVGASMTAMLLLMLMAAGAEEKDLGGHRRWDTEPLRVIEEKCLVCHNLQRIEKALAQRKDMEGLQKRMEQKGAVLTDKERQVLGHFWGKNPFKD